MIYENHAQLVKEIKKTIIDSGLSQKEVAKGMGIAPQGFTKIMNKKNLSFDDLKKILDTMGYQLEIEIKKSPAD